jgi:hypothetical protein
LFHFFDPFINIESPRDSTADTDMKSARGEPMALAEVVDEFVRASERVSITTFFGELFQCESTKCRIVEELATYNEVGRDGSGEFGFFFVCERSVVGSVCILEPWSPTLTLLPERFPDVEG